MTAQCITAKSDCERRLKFNWADASVKLEAGSWKLEAGSWKLEAGSWKLEAGSWKLEAGSWKPIRKNSP